MERQWIPVSGLVATIVAAAYMVVQVHAQAGAPVAPPTADFTNAAWAEIRDAQGQTILRGQFMAPVEEDGRLERRATLTPAGADNDATGDAEVEYAPTGETTQEVEFNGENLQPGLAVTFVIDNIEIAKGTVERDGEVEIELDVPRPGSTARR